MITVYGRATSGNVQFVMWAAAELGLDVERIDLGGAFGGLDTPEFKAMNPNGLIPVVRVGDTILFESAAIVRYLACAHGDENFWPRDPLARATQDKWAEWIKTTFQPTFFGGIWGQLVFTAPAKRNPEFIAQSVKKLEGVAKILDERLSDGRPYLGGDNLSFADIIAGTPLYRYFTLEFERTDTPSLLAYYQRLAARPAYAEHVMVSYESLRVK